MQNNDETRKRDENLTRDRNEDPITKQPGSHPAGTGVGAVAGGALGVGGGAAAGATTGTAMGGPVGAAVGGAVGAIAGAAAGHAAAEKADPTGTGESQARRRGMRDTRSLDQFIDYDVVDMKDDKVGTLRCLWSDHTGEPAYLGVHTGWFFGKTHVVPADRAQVNERERRIRIPYAAEHVKDAPAYEADCDMTDQKENEVRSFYGQHLPTSTSHHATPGLPGTAKHSHEVAEGTSTHHASHTKPAMGKTHASQSREEAEMTLSEETVKIGKREVEAGGVRLRKIVRTEVVNQPVELQREEIVIERVPASEAGTTTKGQIGEQEDLYIPLRREEAVIEKQTKVREVVRASKKRRTDRQEVREQVRKEDVEINTRGQAQETGQRPPAREMADREEMPRSQRRRRE